ncbi:MAG: tryptophan halogenase family protein [Cellvibrionaceae bacterium]
MERTIKKIVIAGGGTAGWITAGLLARHFHPLSKSAIEITLIESSDIPIIGVGEGTWPTMRRTLQKIGIREVDLLRHCHATFKQGSQFHNWKSEQHSHHYTHPFNPPVQAIPELSAYWCHQPKSNFADSLDIQQQLGNLGLSPKTLDMPEYTGVLNYGYHLDAGAIAELIKNHCVNELKVDHKIATIASVKQSPSGDIEAINCEDGQEFSGDLFIDCTGFAALLIKDTLNIDTHKVDDILFADKALAVQVPYTQENINPSAFTHSTAQNAGWIWDIGLSHRRGVGYVYSSQHSNREQAETELASYVGADYPQLSVRELNINSGYRKRFWHKNCVAVGLSAGFIEPLEASALMLIELSANMICERLPANRQVMDRIAQQFNQTFEQKWQRIIDFLKLHYCLSDRQSAFWKDNRLQETIPESLQNMLEVWRYHVPSGYDFSSNNEVFSWASYQYVLYGMDFRTQIDAERLTHPILFENAQQKRQQGYQALRSKLPKLRHYLDQVIEA